MVVIMAGLQFRVIFGLAARRRAARLARLALRAATTTRSSACFTLLDPESDQLGAGYHIIQSQIAIGSGGVFGKGLHERLARASSNSCRSAPPTSSSPMVGEELGLLGADRSCCCCTCSSSGAPCTSRSRRRTRSRACWRGSIALTFFVYVFINAGMVSGLLPVVGVAAAAGQLRRHIDGDPAGGLRYPDVPLLASEARRLVMRHALALTCNLALLLLEFRVRGRLVHRPHPLRSRSHRNPAVRRSHGRGRTRWQPLDVYRLLAKAEPQPKIIELISKPAEKVSPW